MKKPFYQTTGWLGAMTILAAYGLVSFSVVSVHSLIYQGLNILGSLGIVVETIWRKDYQPAFLNIAWILIAIIAIIQIFI